MRINPIIPVWLMAIICVVFLILKRKGIFNYIRQILIILLIFIINLRPMIKNDDVQNVVIDVDVTFVIDNTISMLAEDYDGKGRRIDAVKADCQYIMEQFPGASFSVISFGNTMSRMIPFTIDTNIVIQAIDTLEGQPTLYATGTSLNLILDHMDAFLESNRESYKVVFFISDGEITDDEKVKAHSNLNQYVDGGAVLGYGTEEGGRMQAYSFTGIDVPEYVYDSDFELAVSKIDEDNLERIAKDFGVNYVHMTKQSAIDSQIAAIQKDIEESSYESDIEESEGYTDIYYFFAIPLAVLLIIDFIYYRRKI